MKTLNFIFIVLMFVACASDEATENTEASRTLAKSGSVFTQYNIRIIADGKPEIANEEIAMRMWNDLFEHEENISFGDFKVIQSEPDEMGLTAQFLIGTSPDETIECATLLQEIDDYLTISTTKTCKCEGCTQGCNLYTVGTNCFCTGCKGAIQTCTKTETITIRE